MGEKTRGSKRLSSESEWTVEFKRKRVDSLHPRWHNQAYMLFLALRQHPDRCLPRGELIKEALRLDRQLSKELSLPLVFRGKTPANSASASLTTNSDRYFEPFRVEGSRATWFRLAYEPGDESKAVEAYQHWVKKLFEHDWPFLFGVPQATARYPTPPAGEEAGEWRLEELDVSAVPKDWNDVVYRAPSLIPQAGLGLFAKRRLPANAPIGFYFGVPMSEDEYDSLKERVGRASDYAIMYRRTVLDATDATGEPIVDESHPRYCPFHFMNEAAADQANIVFLEGAQVNQVICWTQGIIEPDQELLVWYGKDVHRHWHGKPEPLTQQEEE
ncbi:hypothetical protein BY458DRAFT_497929 [Sporodiniella umbellata]|nr:hypothetical protein BY458DRAFT_497929 [Sporodiniella umbellata]